MACEMTITVHKVTHFGMLQYYKQQCYVPINYAQRIKYGVFLQTLSEYTHLIGKDSLLNIQLCSYLSFLVNTIVYITHTVIVIH